MPLFFCLFVQSLLTLGMILITGAIKAEIQPLIDKYRCQDKYKLSAATLYRSDYLSILRTGIGPRKSAYALEQTLSRLIPDRVINIGLAGALSGLGVPGKVFYIRRIRREGQESPDLFTDDSFAAKWPAANLLTVSEAVLDSRRKEALVKKYGSDLVDMEAYPQAQLCRQKNIPFFCLKMVSDAADAQAGQDFIKNYAELAVKLGTVAGRMIDRLLATEQAT